jgi:hypothetical protein
MKLYLALLSLLLATAVHAQTTAMATSIREGRAALEAGQPRQARVLFAAALAHPDGEREDTYAAAMGLGKSALWLGDYPAAETAFRMARERAGDAQARQAADTGLAQSFNAQDHPRAAYALVAPFAKGQLRPTLELLRAVQTLGWQDKSPAYLQAVSPPVTRGYIGTQYQLLQDDMRYALAPQLEGSFGYSHDSEGLSVYSFGSAFRFAPLGDAGLVQAWGMAADTTRVADARLARQVSSLSMTSQLRIDDIHYVSVDLGPGRVRGWQYLQGNVSWTVRSSDSFGFTAAAERTPILSDVAIDHRLIYNTYSLGVELRPSTRWYVLPTYYRQTFSDGNQRHGGTLRILLSPYDIPDTSAALGAELSTRIFHSSRPVRGVYFNPARYRTAQLNLVGAYTLDPDWKLRATAGAGRQVIDGAAANVYTVNLSLNGRLPHNGRLKFSLGRSSAASNSSSGGTGYWDNTLMLSISYPL